MGKLNDIQEGRMQGLLLAQKIVKESGVEGLDADIKHRNITGVNLNITKKDLDAISRQTQIYCNALAITIDLATLASDYSWPDSMLKDFKSRRDARALRDLSDDKKFEDDLRIISSKGISISFEED